MADTEMTSFRLPADLLKALRERGETSGDSLSDTLRYAVLLFLGICPTCGQRVAVTGAAEAEPR